MHHLNFMSCPADPDVWLRSAQHNDRSGYYEYILLYTNGTYVINKNAEKILQKKIGRYFELKEDSFGEPKQYLGGQVRKIQLKNGVSCWAFGSSQYVQVAVDNIQKYLNSTFNFMWKMPT